MIKENNSSINKSLSIKDIFNNNSIYIKNSKSKLKIFSDTKNLDIVEDNKILKKINEFSLVNEKEIFYNNIFQKNHNKVQKLDIIDNNNSLKIESSSDDFESDSENIVYLTNKSKKLPELSFKKNSIKIILKYELNHEIEVLRSNYKSNKVKNYKYKSIGKNALENHTNVFHKN